MKYHKDIKKILQKKQKIELNAEKELNDIQEKLENFYKKNRIELATAASKEDHAKLFKEKNETIEKLEIDFSNVNSKLYLDLETCFKKIIELDKDLWMEKIIFADIEYLWKVFDDNMLIYEKIANEYCEKASNLKYTNFVDLLGYYECLKIFLYENKELVKTWVKNQNDKK